MGLGVRLVLGVVTCLVFGCPPVLGISQLETCKADFQYVNYLYLCLGQSTQHTEFKCPLPEYQGFVVEPLFAGSSNQKDCKFTNVNLLNVSCMKTATKRSEDYDEVIFDILDKVSGNGVIDKDIRVPRFPLELQPGTSPQTVGQSAFVAFKQNCKPVMPHPKSDLKVIDICSNTTVNDTRVYLTVRNTLGNSESLPLEPSMCRCNIRLNSDKKRISLRALDIRLQNYTTHECGSSNIKLEWNGKDDNIFCKGKSATYGSENLLSDAGVINDVTLTLGAVNAVSFPTAVWIEAIEVTEILNTPVHVTCEGFLPMPITTTGGDGDDDEDGGNEDTDPNALGPGTNMGVIIGAAGGGVAVLVIIIIVVVLIVRRRRTGSFLPMFCSSRSNKHKPVPQDDVYSQPHNPRPSNPAFVFPTSVNDEEFFRKDPRFVACEEVEGVYAEPQEGGGKITLHTPPPPISPPPPPTTSLPPGTSPPPLPDNHPPPGGPPTGVGTGVSVKYGWPPKPARTFSDAEESKEDYDHINHTLGKPKIKPPLARARDGQNNIIGDNKSDGDDPAASHLYSHLREGEDYPQASTLGKKKVEV